MRKLLLIFFGLIALSTNAQSKGDTQAWVKATIENYTHNTSYDMLNVYFEDEKYILIVELVGSKLYYSEMPIKNINQIFIKKSGSDYVLQLLCSFDKDCCETGTYTARPNGSAIKVPSGEPNKRGINIFLNASIKEDNIDARLRKALTHLITLYGGKIITETF